MNSINYINDCRLKYGFIDINAHINDRGVKFKIDIYNINENQLKYYNKALIKINDYLKRNNYIISGDNKEFTIYKEGIKNYKRVVNNIVFNIIKPMFNTCFILYKFKINAD